MKNQRWPGDYQTKSQEFHSSRREEQRGMSDENASHGNDYIADGHNRPMDRYEISELEPSWTSQLDVIGMQPHSREYLEHMSNNQRSERKFHVFDGQTIDHCPGIHFDGMP